jgi:hypothetical protein
LFINGRVAHRSQGTKKGFVTPRTAGYIKWRHKRFFGLIREEDEDEVNKKKRKKTGMTSVSVQTEHSEVGFQLVERNATIASVCSSIFCSFNVTQKGFISFTQGLRETGPSECKSETGS